MPDSNLLHAEPVEARRAVLQPAMKGVFITGTDTGVGKTVVAACLVRAWHAAYWKPVQSGTEDGDDDTATVTRLAGLSADRHAAPAYALRAPLSPHAAAPREGIAIEFDR